MSWQNRRENGIFIHRSCFRSISQRLVACAPLLWLCVAATECISDLVIPGGMHRIARQVPAGSVVVPAGVQDVYVQRHGILSLSTAHSHFKAPTTQPEPLLPSLLLMFVGPRDKVDVYVPSR